MAKENINQDRFLEITEKVKKHTSADDFVLNYYASDDALTRFAVNMVTQNVTGFEEKLVLTCYFDGKKATLASSNLSDESIISLVGKCEKATKESVVDKEYVPSLGASEQEIEHDIDDAVFNMGPNERALMAKYAIERAKKENATAYGIVQNSTNGFGVATKNGAEKFYMSTQVEYKNTLDINGEKGAAWTSSHNLDDIDVRSLYEDAFKDAEFLQKRIEREPGRYKVLLSSRAASQIFSMMGWYAFDRRAIDEGYSPLSGKIGSKLFDDRISILTDPDHHTAKSSPFTHEGMPINKRYIAKNGVIEDIPTSRFWARKNNLDPWALSNLIIPDTDIPEEKLLAKIDKGFYIKELWYIRLVRMKDLTLTGMTRNGFFYVEDGMIVRGATHFRWNDSPLSMLNRIVDLGQAQASIPQWGRSSSIPAMLVDDFYLSSKTLF